MPWGLDWGAFWSPLLWNENLEEKKSLCKWEALGTPWWVLFQQRENAIYSSVLGAGRLVFWPGKYLSCCLFWWELALCLRRVWGSLQQKEIFLFVGLSTNRRFQKKYWVQWNLYRKESVVDSQGGFPVWRFPGWRSREWRFSGWVSMVGSQGALPGCISTVGISMMDFHDGCPGWFFQGGFLEWIPWWISKVDFQGGDFQDGDFQGGIPWWIPRVDFQGAFPGWGFAWWISMVEISLVFFQGGDFQGGFAECHSSDTTSRALLGPAGKGRGLLGVADTQTEISEHFKLNHPLKTPQRAGVVLTDPKKKPGHFASVSEAAGAKDRSGISRNVRGEWQCWWELWDVGELHWGRGWSGDCPGGAAQQEGFSCMGDKFLWQEGDTQSHGPPQLWVTTVTHQRSRYNLDFNWKHYFLR